MASNADSRIIIDTDIDSQGFKKGSNEMHKAIKSLIKTMESLGPVFDKAVKGSIRDTQKISEKTDILNKKIAKYREQLDLLGKKQIPTKEYDRAVKSLDEWAGKADVLRAKLKRLDNLGVGKNTQRYKSLSYDYEEAVKKADDYFQIVQKIENEGRTHISGNQTEEYQALSIQLEQAEQELSRLSLEGESMSQRLSDSFSNMKKNFADVINEMRNAPTLTQQISTSWDNFSNKFGNIVAGKLIIPILEFKWKVEDAIGGVVTGLHNKLLQSKGPVGNLYKFAIQKIVDVKGKLPGVFDSLKEKASSVGNSLRNFLSDPKGSLQSGFVNMALSAFKSFDSIKNKASETGQRIKQAFSKESLQSFAQSAGQAWDTFMQKSYNAITQIPAKLNQGLGSAVAGVKKLGSIVASGVGNALRTAATSAGQIALKLGGAALSGAKKLGGAILSGIVTGLKRAVSGAAKLAKNLGSKIVSGVKKAASGLTRMKKSADGLSKKFTKMGLALIGMRGVMGGIRQLVSSALNNNEKLQKQLTAVKGVLGQALAPAINILVQGLSQIITFADKIYQIFTGTSIIAKYNAQQTEKAADGLSDAEKNAKKLNRQLAGFDSLNVLSDNSSDKSSNSDDKTALFEATDISGWLSDIIKQIKNGDWYSVGDTIAGGINSALTKIDWTSIQEKANKLAGALGSAVNGFVDGLDWNLVGSTIGNALNTATGAINTFVDAVKWDNLGSGIATGLNGLVDTIDGEALGKTLSAKLKILTETLYGFFNGTDGKEGFNFTNLGTKIGDTVNGWFNNIDWSHVGNNISSAIAGLGDTISGAMDAINWNDGEGSITQKIKDFFMGIDWAKMCTSVLQAIGKALGGLGSVVVQLLKDAWTSWKSTYIDPAVEEAGGNIIEGVFNGIVNWLKNIGTWIYDNILVPFIDGFKSTFDIHSPSKNPDILELGKNLISGVFNGIVNWLKDIKAWFKDNVFGKITDAWDGMKDLAINIGGNIMPSFTDAKAEWDSIKEKGKEALATLKSKLSDKFNEHKKKWEAIKSKSPLATLKSKVTDGFKNAKKTWEGIKDKAKNFSFKGSLTQSFKNAQSSWNGIKDKAATVTASVKDGITSAIRSILQSLCNMVNKVIDVLNKIIPGVNISKITPPKLAKGGVVNKRGSGVNAIIGEAGPEAVIPLNKTVLGTIANMIVGFAKKELLEMLKGSTALIREIAVSGKTAPYSISNNAISKLESFVGKIDSDFSNIASQLQAIATGVNYRIPEAVNVIPNKSKVGNDVANISKAFDMSNEELINVLIQLFNNQTRELIAAIKALKLTVPSNRQSEIDGIIKEIKRRERVTGSNPVLS